MGVMATTDDWLAKQDVGRLRNAEDLMAFTGWVVESGIGRAQGYISATNDPATRRMTFLWHGLSPLQQALMKESLRRDITAAFVDCPYSWREIELAVGAITATAGDSEWRGLVLTGISAPSTHFLGLTVSGYSPRGRPDGIHRSKRISAGSARPWDSDVLPTACSPELILHLCQFTTAAADMPTRVQATPSSPMPFARGRPRHHGYLDLGGPQ